VPTQLLTVEGIRRDRRAEQDAFEAEPLREIQRLYPKALHELYRQNWESFLPVQGQRIASEIKAKATAHVRPVRAASSQDVTALTSGLRNRAAEVGLSAIGVAPYDPKYTFAPYLTECAGLGDRVILCLMEANFGAIQTVPSPRAEKAQQAGSWVAVDRASELAYFLHERGFRAAALRPDRFVLIHYAVEAGLGQLGRNGQLLTPVAGSRVRMVAIQTDAPLVFDRPVDYGVTALCDACMVCVKRCPPSAIPHRRDVHRGVEKARINIARCYPVMIKAHGCAVCTKVCPVQRFGLQPVLDEFAESGKILGKGTDELEGYDWVDGEHYGPVRRPKFDKEIFQGLGFDVPLKSAADESELGKGTGTSLM
jgi:ferredoxin